MKALDLAGYVIDKGNYLNNFKLNKILYLLHCYYMMKTGKELIDEDFEAWSIGPVIPEVFEEYSIYAGAPIISFYEIEYSIDPQIEEVIRKLARNLTYVKPWEINDMTMFDGSAWSKAYEKGKRNRIYPSLIREDIEKTRKEKE